MTSLTAEQRETVERIRNAYNAMAEYETLRNGGVVQSATKWIGELLNVIDALVTPPAAVPAAPDDDPPFDNKPFLADDGKWYEVCCAKCDSTNIADKGKDWDDDGFAYFIYYCKDCKRYSEVYARETSTPAVAPPSAEADERYWIADEPLRIVERETPETISGPYTKADAQAEFDRIVRMRTPTGFWTVKGGYVPAPVPPPSATDIDGLHTAYVNAVRDTGLLSDKTRAARKALDGAQPAPTSAPAIDPDVRAWLNESLSAKEIGPDGRWVDTPPAPAVKLTAAEREALTRPYKTGRVNGGNAVHFINEYGTPLCGSGKSSHMHNFRRANVHYCNETVTCKKCQQYDATGRRALEGGAKADEQAAPAVKLSKAVKLTPAQRKMLERLVKGAMTYDNYRIHHTTVKALLKRGWAKRPYGYQTSLYITDAGKRALDGAQ